ncbi:hypothetical protein A8B83_13905 [Rhodobacteraceae bacterium EhC02]|nr:hypothetical protein A8B83_13905 [Rhodobacteraceae bacterium EhC02]
MAFIVEHQLWSLFPMVGKDVAPKVIDRLVEYFGAHLVEGSGDSGLFKDENGKWAKDPRMTMYEVDLSSLPEKLEDARFVQVGLPTVKVNKAETRQQRDKRNLQKQSKPFLNNKQCTELFGDAHTAAESRVEALNQFWLQHPLKMPNGHSAASATRVYHDGRMDAGGRLYGAWTGLDKGTERLFCTIDGDPICEIDIKASQPTLFSSLLGYRLGGLEKGEQWWDVYSQLSRLGSVNHWWTVVDDTIDVMEQIKRNRKVAKAVVMELIGSGNSLKSRATDDLVKETGLMPQGWESFREQLVRTVPALEELEPRYNKQGAVEGYLNGAGFLSYHESEMMMLTLERLAQVGIPAYPVHDCLIVKTKDAIVAAKTFREVIHQYCKKMNGLEVLVPLSVEVGDGVSTDKLPEDKDLIGEYLN